MSNQLVEMYQEWIKRDGPGDGSADFYSFQGGLTAGAVSMRQRAMEIARKHLAGSFDIGLNLVEDVVNEIGQLSDIPSEET